MHVVEHDVLSEKPRRITRIRGQIKQIAAGERVTFPVHDEFHFSFRKVGETVCDGVFIRNDVLQLRIDEFVHTQTINNDIRYGNFFHICILSHSFSHFNRFFQQV